VISNCNLINGCFWPVAHPDDHKLTDRNRCITAAQGSVATVRFGSKGRSGATYQVRIPDHSKTAVLKTLLTRRCLNI
jgi:hypothetical protein